MDFFLLMSNVDLILTSNHSDSDNNSDDNHNNKTDGNHNNKTDDNCRVLAAVVAVILTKALTKVLSYY